MIAVRVPPGQGLRPLFHDGRALERIASSTGRMPQPVLEGLLLERSHLTQRWETQKAVGITGADLAQEEILRTLRAGGPAAGSDAGRSGRSTGAPAVAARWRAHPGGRGDVRGG